VSLSQAQVSEQHAWVTRERARIAQGEPPRDPPASASAEALVSAVAILAREVAYGTDPAARRRCAGLVAAVMGEASAAVLRRVRA
jgi:hypothetical protein